MNQHGVIYQAPGLAKRIFYRLLRSLGAGLVAFAIVGIIFSFYPIVKEEFLYYFGTKEDVQINKFADLIGKSQAEGLGINPYFSIFIPKIDAKADIIPNVNAGDPESYLDALNRGVAHAAGTNFPGSGKTIYLFSHSTDSPVNIARFNAVFYLLRKLEPRDRIVIYFMSRQYVYIVEKKFVTSASDTSWLNDDGLGERLILQTCDPPGTSWNRLLVIARPISEISN